MIYFLWHFLLKRRIFYVASCLLNILCTAGRGTTCTFLAPAPNSVACLYRNDNWAFFQSTLGLKPAHLYRQAKTLVLNSEKYFKKLALYKLSVIILEKFRSKFRISNLCGACQHQKVIFNTPSSFFVFFNVHCWKFLDFILPSILYAEKG